MDKKSCKHKTCSQANPQPFSAFPKNSRTKDRLSSWCKKCHSKRSATRQKNDPAVKRGYDLKSRYGITEEQYSALIVLQGHKCAGCGRPSQMFNYRLCVDHCHKSNKIRGLLCKDCNLALGHIRDNISTLLSLANYLVSFGGQA